MKISKYLNISIFVFLFVFVLIIHPNSVEAVATTRTVCPDPVGSCSPSDPLFKGAGGIILAIAASVDGDTVSIKNGTYSGFVLADNGISKYFILLNKNLTITGESTSDTIISGTGVNKGSIFLVDNTAASTISNLSITGGQLDCPGTPCSYGLGVEVKGTGSETLSLTNLRIFGNEYGIWSYGSSKVSISNNTINSNVKNGVYISATSNLNMSNSLVYDNLTGIRYGENSSGIVSGSTIRNNTGNGVFVEENSVVSVNNNLIYSNAHVGLRLYETSQTTGTGNTIYSNLYTGHASGVFCSESAVLGTWTNNNVWNNANGNYGSDPVGLCTDKTGTNGNISIDPQSLLNPAPILPDTAIAENSLFKVILSFIAIFVGMTFLSRHFATISKEDN